VAALGGVDVDKLARFDEESLRKYVRDILDKCMPGGRYALGSGNSVTNYVPPKNYITMLEEGLKWKPKIHARAVMEK
jgi:uroporphyrinogen decarboxylase